VPARALIQIRGAKVLPVQAGMNIGLNQGVVKEISEDSLILEEQLPVCGKVGFYSRTTVMSVDKALPAGTTVVFTVKNGRNECQ
jgi:Tfp pilus assembly protein PilP